jgi:hypothetical protein
MLEKNISEYKILLKKQSVAFFLFENGGNVYVNDNVIS